MTRAKRPTVSTEAWTALMFYLMGYACIGFLFKVPADPAFPTALMGMVAGIVILAWAGAEAAAGAKTRSFVQAIIGAYAVAGALGWAVSLAGTTGSAATTIVALIWGVAWLVTQATQIASEEAPVLLMIALILIAIVAGATNSALLGAGIVFTFVACTSPAIGEQLGETTRPGSAFSLLLTTAAFGFALGWLV